MPFLAIALNTEPVKYAILALSAPLWIPFFKALWHTLNEGLREEGGLLGRPPTEEQLAELEKHHGPAGASLISVLKDGPLGASGGGMGRRGTPSTAGAGRAGARSRGRADPGRGDKPAQAQRPRRQGFR